MDKLELLSYAENYIVKKEEDGYNIDCKNANLGTFIDNNKTITYYMTDCFNSGIDCIEIDIEELEKLKNFCELMIK